MRRQGGVAMLALSTQHPLGRSATLRTARATSIICLCHPLTPCNLLDAGPTAGDVFHLKPQLLTLGYLLQEKKKYNTL